MDFHSLPRDRYGYDCVFVVVDRLSKQPVSVPCHNDIGAKETARLFIEYIYRHHGPPDTIVSDRGSQFVSAFWDELCAILGIHLKLSTAHHAQTDGQTEIVNQQIDRRLRPFVSYYQDNWSELLPMVDFAASILPSETTGLSPFLTACGYEPRTSFDWRDINPCHGLRPLNGLSRAIKPSSSIPFFFFLVLISSSSVFPFLFLCLYYCCPMGHYCFI